MHRGLRALGVAYALPLLVIAASVLPGRPASAAPGFAAKAVVVDPPTQTSIGVVLPIDGDEDFDASVQVTFRPAGIGPWRTAQPLFRVRPDDVHREDGDGGPVPAQFAGSVFDLLPDVTYEVRLHIAEPDSGYDEVRTERIRTAAVPHDPATAIRQDVGPSTLQAWLDKATPGLVLTLQPGDYQGPIYVRRGGDATNPLVLRGLDRDGVKIHGRGPDLAEAAVDVQAGFVHIENLTVRDAYRGIRFQDVTDGQGKAVGTRGNVVRHVTMRETRMAITSGEVGHTGAYICDNDLEGKIPVLAYYGDGRANASMEGIVVGSGSVVCHNTIKGYADAINVAGKNTRGVDVYGNDVRWSYDNGVETDFSEGNVRVFRNRFLNTYSPLSFQPIFGGPVYAFRNVMVNVHDEAFKFRGQLPFKDHSDGVLVYNNTVVSANTALMVNTDRVSANFAFENNLFMSPSDGGSQHRPAAWYAGVVNAMFDYNAYYPEAGPFTLGGKTHQKLGEFTPEGWEQHGRTVGSTALAALGPWPDWNQIAGPGVGAAPAASSPLRDHAVYLPNLNESADGSPDIGAVEAGCTEPSYGERPAGADQPGQGAGQCGDPTQPGQTDVEWTSLVNASANGAVLRKAGGDANAQDAGGYSRQRVGPGGAATAELGWPDVRAEGCVGLNDTNAGTSCAEIDYRLVLQFDPKTGTGLASAFHATGYLGDVHFTGDDRLRITVAGGQVTFAKVAASGGPAAVFAAEPVAAAETFGVDTSLWNPGSAVRATLM